jgi:hypothetical protein
MMTSEHEPNSPATLCEALTIESTQPHMNASTDYSNSFTYLEFDSIQLLAL